MTVPLRVTPVYRITSVIVLWQLKCWVQHCDMGKISLFKL